MIMNKLGTATAFVIIVLILMFIGVYFFYACDIQTYKYAYKTSKMEEEIITLGCYEQKGRADASLFSQCSDLIEEHNSLIREWNELPCVGVKLVEEIRVPDSIAQEIVIS